MKFTYDHSDEKEWEEYEEYIPELPPVPPVPTMDLPEAEGEIPEVELLQRMDTAKEEETPYRESPYEDDSASRGFGFGFGLGKSEIEETEDEEEKTVFLAPAEEEEEEKTVLLVPPTQITVKLIRCATGEEFVLNGSMNIVGKSKIRADIRIQNNPAIGNVHCKITREENAFYLEDNKSLNGTYLENVKLKPEVKTLLETENRIRLADEEFIFRAE